MGRVRGRDVTALLLAELSNTGDIDPEAPIGTYLPPHDVPGHLDGLPTPPFDIPALAGAGALRSSAADLTALLRALLCPDGTPLAAALHEVQQSRMPVEERQSTELIWNRREFRFGNVLFHGGNTAGSSAFLAFCPDHRLAILALSNAAMNETALIQQAPTVPQPATRSGPHPIGWVPEQIRARPVRGRPLG